MCVCVCVCVFNPLKISQVWNWVSRGISAFKGSVIPNKT